MRRTVAFLAALVLVGCADLATQPIVPATWTRAAEGEHSGIADVFPGAGLYVLASRTDMHSVHEGFAFMTVSHIPEEAFNA